MENRYRSRKFIITILGLSLGFVAAYMGILSPALSNIVLAAISSYNIANAWSAKNGG